MRSLRPLAGAILTGALAAAPVGGWSASHSDAPAIKQDPQANITDVYAFVGTRYDDPGHNVLNVLVQVRPFSEPGDGVVYDRFADDARYSIHITDPVSGQSVRRYDFTFSAPSALTPPGLKNPDTILSYGLGTEVGPIVDIGDARQNFTQTYSVTAVDLVAGTDESIGMSLPTPPPNVGLNTTPAYNDPATGIAVSGAQALAELDPYTRQAIAELSNGLAAFAGPREDGFFADTPAIFDLLDGRILDNDGDPGDGLGQDGGGVDGFKGYNVLAFGLQIPVDQLSTLPGAPVVGVYASVSRKRITIRTSRGSINTGAFVQVNRMGNPLFNEVLVPLADKDRYNLERPTNDAALFAPYAENPELAVLINTVFGTDFVATDRADIRSVYIPDVLRVDVTTDPVPLPGDPDFRRLSFIDDDLVTSAGGFLVPGGWPNGRRIGDDVIDIVLSVLASGPEYETGYTVVGDNVPANDALFHRVFPYLGTPHAGPANIKDSTPPATD